MRQLSTLLLSLLLCATCLAQPDSRPGPYQATLAKINALLVGGAATVKEIEFTVDGSALASSSKTQVYSDGNAGNVTANVPAGKAIKLAVAGSEVGRFDAGGITSTVAFQLSNIAAALPSGISYLAHSTNLVLNSSSGYISLRNAGTERLRVTDTYTYVQPGLLQLGTTTSGIVNGSATTGSVAVSGGGTIGSGGTVTCYGSAHSTNPGQIGIAGPITFTGSGSASSALSQMWADAANGNLFTNVPTGKYEHHRVAGAGLLSLGRASSTQGDSAWAIGPYAANGALSATSPGIYAIATSIVSNVPSGSVFLLNFADTSKYRFAAALAEFDRLSLGGTIGSSVDPGAGGLYLVGSSNIRGGQKVATTTKTTTYTATSADYIILGNHATVAFTINLPAATGSGQIFIIKNINTAAVTVDANASETIDGSLTQVLAINNSITIVDYATGLWAIV